MKPLTTLLTGATGSIGANLIASLINDGLQGPIGILARPSPDADTRQVQLLHAVHAALHPTSSHTPQTLAQTLLFIPGDVTYSALTHTPIAQNEIRLIIHAAADTRFRALPGELHSVNVQGTRNTLAFAAECPHLKRFLFVSTCCIAGTRTGLIPEAPVLNAPQFLNPYEESKWQAERLAQTSGLPVTTARLSTVIGSEKTGSIARPGALHHALKWMYRGLIPMVPGGPQTHVDLISCEFAATYLARLALTSSPVPEIIHVAAGSLALTLSELLSIAVETFKSASPAWRFGQIAPPMPVDAQTYNLFQDSVTRSGDTLFKTVMDSSAAFLPGLLYPKAYQTTRAQTLFSHPPATMHWQSVLPRVIAQNIAPNAPTLQHSREARHD